MYKIILASESPRRKEIMSRMGIPFESLTAGTVEITKEQEPSKMVEALAELKTRDIDCFIKEDNTDHIIIGADTMVFYKEHALGKPKDKEDAFRMLKMLSGETHEVYTGVSIIIRKKEAEVIRQTFSVCTKVTVHALTEELIRDYIETEEPMDKAGAYAIQGLFGLHIKEISGDYYNVVGFPIAKIYQVLLEHGINLKKII